MHFTTLPFAAFFVLVGTLAWALRSHRTAQKLLLLGSSCFFYARWDTRLLALLLGVSIGNYLLGERIERTRGSPRSGSPSECWPTWAPWAPSSSTSSFAST